MNDHRFLLEGILLIYREFRSILFIGLWLNVYFNGKGYITVFQSIPIQMFVEAVQNFTKTER
ncbi:MAG TPA: hypothetical protein DHM90_11055 [Clostridiaceae bacterium]|nr:hypothetical protein [Clostridiaceae bacterium]